MLSKLTEAAAQLPGKAIPDRGVSAKQQPAPARPSPAQAKATADKKAATASTEIQKLKELIAARDARLKELTQQLKTAQSESQSTAAELKRQNTAVADQKKVVEEKTAELATALVELSQARELVTARSAELDRVAGEVKSLTTLNASNLHLLNEMKAKEEQRAQAEALAAAAKRSTTPVSICNQFLSEFEIGCPPEHVKAVREKTGFNVVPLEVGVRGRNSHYLLAIYRTAATVYTLCQAVKDGHRDIDIIYHNERDKVLGGKLAAKINSSCEEQVSFNFCDGIVTPADYSRRMIPAGRNAKSTAAIAVDVYYATETTREPFSLRAVRDYGYNQLYWLAHPFPGQFGTVGTAAWMRRPDGDIVWSSDSVNNWYPPHPACDALHRNSADGHYCSFVAHSWSYEKTCVYELIKIVTSELIQDPEPIREAPTNWYKTEMKFYGSTGLFSKYVLDYLPAIIRQRLPVHTVELCLNQAHVLALRAELGHKGRSHWTFANFQASVSTLLKNDRSYQLLVETFPLEFLNYQRDLTLFSFGYFAEADASAMRAMRDAYGDSLTAYDVQRRSINTRDANPTVPPYLMGGLLVLLFGYGLWSRRYTKASSAQWLRAALRWLAARLRWIGAKLSIPLRWVGNKLGTLASKTYTRSPQANIQSLQDRAANQLARSKALFQSAASTGNEATRKAAEAAQAEANRLLAQVSQLATAPDRGSTLVHCLLLPLVEELIKAIPYVQPFAVMCIAAADCYQYEKPGFKEFLFHSFMHYLFAGMGPAAGTVWHCAWNLFVSKYQSTGFKLCSSAEALKAIVDRIKGLTLRPVAPTEAEKAVENFDDHYYYTEQPLFKVDDRVLTGHIGLDQSFVPAVNLEPHVEVQLDPRLHVTGDLTAMATERDCKETIGYYRAYYHNHPMFRPAKTGSNMATVVCCRLLKAVTPPTDGWWDLAYNAFSNGGYAIGDCDCPRCHLPAISPADSLDEIAIKNLTRLTVDTILEAPKGGAYITQMMREFDPHYELSDETLTEWLEHTDRAKRKRYESALETVLNAPLQPASKKVTMCQINIKTDEVLLKVRKDDSTNGSIPRPIHAVDPTVAVTLGPQIHLATKYLKTILNRQAFGRVGPYHIKIYFAAGASDVELSKWFTAAVYGADDPDTRTITIFVAGDDSLLVTPWGILTGDLSACDRTISLEALLAEASVLRDQGVTSGLLEILMASCHATLRASVNSTSNTCVFVTRHWERNTGGVDTTYGNSVCVIQAWHLAVILVLADPPTLGAPLSQQHLSDINTTFTNLGLSLKLRVSELPFRPGAPPAEFLKGWWLPSTDRDGVVDFAWTFLPSRFLKCSKTLHDPRLTMRRGDRPSFDVAMARFMDGISSCLLEFGNPPMIRRVLTNWQLPGSEHFRWWEEENPIWVRAAHCAFQITDDDFLEACAVRYGQEVPFWAEFFELLAEVRVGSVFYHPAWTLLAADYA